MYLNKWEMLARAGGFASRNESDSVALLSQGSQWVRSNVTHLESGFLSVLDQGMTSNLARAA